MSGDADLAARRARRDAARARFEEKFAAARQDLAPDAIKARLVNDAKVKAIDLAHEAMAIAGDSRGVIAGTVTALALWAARRKIGAEVLKRWQDHTGKSDGNPFAGFPFPRFDPKPKEKDPS